MALTSLLVHLSALPCAAGRLLQGLNEDCQTIQLAIGEKVGSTCRLAGWPAGHRKDMRCIHAMAGRAAVPR